MNAIQPIRGQESLYKLYNNAYRTRRVSAEYNMQFLVQQVLSIHTSVIVTDDRSNSFNFLLRLQLLIYNHFYHKSVDSI